MEGRAWTSRAAVADPRHRHRLEASRAARQGRLTPASCPTPSAQYGSSFGAYDSTRTASSRRGLRPGPARKPSPTPVASAVRPDNRAHEPVHAFGSCRSYSTANPHPPISGGPALRQRRQRLANDSPGCNFFDNNNDPPSSHYFSPPTTTATGRAQDATEQGNDGQLDRVCPHCQVMPGSIWTRSSLGNANTFALGVPVPTDNGASDRGANGSPPTRPSPSRPAGTPTTTFRATFPPQTPPQPPPPPQTPKDPPPPPGKPERKTPPPPPPPPPPGDDLTQGNHNYPANSCTRFDPGHRPPPVGSARTEHSGCRRETLRASGQPACPRSNAARRHVLPRRQHHAVPAHSSSLWRVRPAR